mmetsp:Transcript_30416/g.72336  ORF Transcript_30416/g.72336 Transcript_30416/m.72336 type:complete len:203 (-) Transcript_30416:990-1598(-)
MAKSTRAYAALDPRISQRSSQSTFKLKGASSSSTRPLLASEKPSRRECSSTWLMIPRRASAEVTVERTKSWYTGLRSSASRRSELNAITEFSGVRSSCDMLARKRRLRRAAVSASITAVWSAVLTASALTTMVRFLSTSVLICAIRIVATMSRTQKLPERRVTLYTFLVSTSTTTMQISACVESRNPNWCAMSTRGKRDQKT